MQHLGIRSIVTRKYKYQQNSGKLPENKENLLNHDFKASNIFQKLVTNITYIHVKPLAGLILRLLWTFTAEKFWAILTAKKSMPNSLQMLLRMHV